MTFVQSDHFSPLTKTAEIVPCLGSQKAKACSAIMWKFECVCGPCIGSYPCCDTPAGLHYSLSCSSVQTWRVISGKICRNVSSNKGHVQVQKPQNKSKLHKNTPRSKHNIYLPDGGSGRTHNIHLAFVLWSWLLGLRSRVYKQLESFTLFYCS